MPAYILGIDADLRRILFPRPKSLKLPGIMAKGSLYLFLLAATFCCACKPTPPVIPPATTTPVTLQLEPGIRLTTRTLQRTGIPMSVWLYLPTPSTSGPATANLLPCVLIAPAGSRLFHGMSLEAGDRIEHLPYVRAGFAVVAFDIDGPLPESPTNGQAANAIDAFRQARAGIDNAIAAFDYAASLPQIDMNRIYIAGHSSAATLALQVAEHEPRIAGCAAFAPACDLSNRLNNAHELLDGIRPGTFAFLTQLSPDRHADALNCPTLLFSARDDDNVPTASVAAFAHQLEKTNPRVKMITVNSGGHSQSMMEQGIPAAIEFFRSLARIPNP